MHEAYQSKKWAFTSDYVRMDVVYRYGGVYMDTDIELLQPIDRFLCDTAFCGMEAPYTPALSLPFGALAGNELIRAFRDMYNNMSFIKDDGSLDLTTCTVYQAMAFRQLGLSKENRLQKAGGFVVYPTDVFCPVFSNLIYECFTPNTHSIHHFAGSWYSREASAEKMLFVNKFRKIFAQLCDRGIYHELN